MNETPNYENESSLEEPASVVLASTTPEARSATSSKRRLKWIIILTLILFLVGVGLFVRSIKPTKPVSPTVVPVTINTQTLDNGTLNKLAPPGPGTTTKAQLTIAADTLFKNSVQVQGDTKLGKNADVGGNLNIAGTTTLQSAVSVNSNLAVRGSLSVGGTISAGSLNVGSLGVTNVTASGNVNFGGHLVPTGTAPVIRTGVGTGGGTAEISGNDTAGTVIINTGSSPAVAGDFVVVTFHTAFNTTPKVQLTPLNGAAAGLHYYATRSADLMTITTDSVPTSNTTYSFDYLVTQ